MTRKSRNRDRWANLWDATCLRLSRGTRMTVGLDRLMIGHQGSYPLERWVHRSQEWSRVSRSLEDSPYVRFLEEANDQNVQDDDWLRSTEYFRMAETCMAATGRFKGANDGTGILSHMRQYYANHQSKNPNRDAPRDSAVPGAPIKVFRIKQSRCFEIIDGHERLASAYVKGQRVAEVTVYSEKLSYLQNLLLEVNQADGMELYQPLPTLDVETWPVVRGCADRFQMMSEFLGGEGRTQGTVLDLACSYGWFVNRFKDAGFRARGIDRDPSALHVGTCIFGLGADELWPARIEAFLAEPRERYDVVLFLSILHHYALGQERAPLDLILKGLDSITRHVLFLDTGEGHEAWYRETLAEWTPEYIRNLILERTSFTSVVVLGTDGDAREPYAENYGRSLFACTR
jgi:2-polyprenyl-3-methyl-5-hydroxy-6-metoxy-1,4-benzoquinol methylase